MRPTDRARVAAERHFLDSVRAEVIEGLRAKHIDPRGLVVVDLGTARNDVEVQTYTSLTAGEAVNGVLRAHAHRLAEWPGRESTFFLRLDPSPPPAPGARECAPRLLYEASLARDARREVAHSGDPGLFTRGAPRVSVHVRMLVDRNGQVVHAFLTRRSNRPEIDRVLLDLARRQRFEPATVDGIPVDTWVQLPFDLRSP